jgi:ferredoxin
LGIAVLYAATGSHFIICRFDPIVSFFRLNGSATMIFFGAIFLLLGMLIARPYCRFLCPYGFLLNWFSKLSKWHVTITPDECIECRLCEDSCSFGAIRKPWEGAVRPSRKEIHRTALLILLFPFIIATGIWIGKSLAIPLSQADARVRLAQQIRREDSDQNMELTIESETFRSTGKPVADLYQDVFFIQKQFQRGGLFLGAFLGLVFGGTLIFLSLQRRGKEYEPDRGLCLSCGRCFAYCPREQVRSKTLGEEDDTSYQDS